MKYRLAKWFFGSLALSSLALSGCARHPTDPTNDPFEGYNRVMFGFNQDVDHLVFRPAATAYSKITPPQLQAGVTNFFDNINEIITFPNDFLQGNFRYMAVDFWRFVINTTVGVGGLFDVATRLGIQPHAESFGLTLAKWRGGQSAPYFIIPLLGPATIQSGIGIAADYYTTPWPYLHNQTINYIANGVQLINIRAQLLPADQMVANAFDPYIFVRDAYLQREKEKIARNEALPKIPDSTPVETNNTNQTSTEKTGTK
ncbi:MAG TPA: VacJ family lipoprotein [Coxiellaceae bacterium]|nr:MAG: hypothetical protein A3E81_00620 [Gammaproteobacteria bacterium RIFCSPHIGHO2_12_FULL_36_30]HLB56662.1 VacJ family lipoprotein [Coxiellaceae bacterium]